MREDNAEKSAREGLIDYAKARHSDVQRTKACGCPLAGCTVACRKRKSVRITYDTADVVNKDFAMPITITTTDY